MAACAAVRVHIVTLLSLYTQPLALRNRKLTRPPLGLGTLATECSMAPPRVVGLGDPVMDILAHVSHDYLASVASEPGGCFAIPPEEMATLLASAGKQSELNRYSST